MIRKEKKKKEKRREGNEDLVSGPVVRVGEDVVRVRQATIEEDLELVDEIVSATKETHETDGIVRDEPPPLPRISFDVSLVKHVGPDRRTLPLSVHGLGTHELLLIVPHVLQDHKKSQKGERALKMKMKRKRKREIETL